MDETYPDTKSKFVISWFLPFSLPQYQEYICWQSECIQDNMSLYNSQPNDLLVYIGHGFWWLHLQGMLPHPTWWHSDKLDIQPLFFKTSYLFWSCKIRVTSWRFDVLDYHHVFDALMIFFNNLNICIFDEISINIIFSYCMIHKKWD